MLPTLFQEAEACTVDGDKHTQMNTHKQISFSVVLKMFFEYLSKNVQFLFLRYSNCITKHFLMAACQESRDKNHKIVMILLTRQSLINRFQLNLWLYIYIFFVISYAAMIFILAKIFMFVDLRVIFPRGRILYLTIWEKKWWHKNNFFSQKFLKSILKPLWTFIHRCNNLL